jgi:hypothetical protein
MGESSFTVRVLAESRSATIETIGKLNDDKPPSTKEFGLSYYFQISVIYWQSSIQNIMAQRRSYDRRRTGICSV